MDAGSETLVDFHTHSHFSDGVLAPAPLVERARARGVGTLALTDHDTTAGLGEARGACQQSGIRFVPGVELSDRDAPEIAVFLRVPEFVGRD